MKKCNDCNIEMVENTNLHTDYVGGVRRDEQIFLSVFNDATVSKTVLEKGKGIDENITKRVKARVCPNCGKVELYIDLNEDK